MQESHANSQPASSEPTTPSVVVLDDETLSKVVGGLAGGPGGNWSALVAGPGGTW